MRVPARGSVPATRTVTQRALPLADAGPQSPRIRIGLSAFAGVVNTPGAARRYRDLSVIAQHLLHAGRDSQCGDKEPILKMLLRELKIRQQIARRQ